MPSDERPPSIRPLLATATTAIVGGGLIGAMTNAINGVVSTAYFRNIMRWNDPNDIVVWRAGIAQGVFEGLIYGVVFAVVFTLVVGVATRCRCYFYEVWPTLRNAFLAVIVCWMIGGVLAMGLATLSPEFYRNSFRHVPEDFSAMLRYAWVGGSIWGGMIGGLLSLVISSIAFANFWRADRSRSIASQS